MPPAYATLVVGNPVTRPARNIKWGVPVSAPEA